ncbi:Helicase IV [compost metagenome]
MIPGGEAIVPFNRDGDKPVVQLIKDEAALHDQLIQQISNLKSEGYEMIAVICKTAAESLTAYEALSPSLQVKLIKKTTLSFEKGVHIIPAYLAKGVEFDAVLIYDGSNEKYTREAERKLFYTACTRAMHLLHIFSIGAPSRFISEVEQSTYELR